MRCRPRSSRRPGCMSGKTTGTTSLQSDCAAQASAGILQLNVTSSRDIDMVIQPAWLILECPLFWKSRQIKLSSRPRTTRSVSSALGCSAIKTYATKVACCGMHVPSSWRSENCASCLMSQSVRREPADFSKTGSTNGSATRIVTGRRRGVRRFLIRVKFLQVEHWTLLKQPEEWGKCQKARPRTRSVREVGGYEKPGWVFTLGTWIR